MYCSGIQILKIGLQRNKKEEKNIFFSSFVINMLCVYAVPSTRSVTSTIPRSSSGTITAAIATAAITTAAIATAGKEVAVYMKNSSVETVPGPRSIACSIARSVATISITITRAIPVTRHNRDSQQGDCSCYNKCFYDFC